MSVIVTIRAGVKDARTGWQDIAMLFAAALILAVVNRLFRCMQKEP